LASCRGRRGEERGMRVRKEGEGRMQTSSECLAISRIKVAEFFRTDGSESLRQSRTRGKSSAATIYGKKKQKHHGREIDR
jgi:hypothetical protein